MFWYLRRLSLVVVAAAALSLGGCGEPVKVPTSYAKWEPASEAIFFIEYPEGWKADGGGKKGIQWAEFKKSGCLIKCSTDVSSSLIGDIVGSANTAAFGGEALSPEELKELAPAAQVHKLNKDKAREDYGSYKEEKEAIQFNSGLGDARKSVFTGSLTGRRVKGYRATFLGKDRGVTVFCHCSEKEFAKMQPAFDKVLESVKRGNF